MPLVRYKSKIFKLRWSREWDINLLIAALKFRKGCSCSFGPHVDWIMAEAQGYLKGLPENLSRQDLSRRLYYLLHVRYDPVESKRRQAYYKNYHFKRNKSYQNKLSVFKEIPEVYKKKYGYKSKRKWNKKQLDVLFYLIKKYHPKGSEFINWKSLMKDNLIKCLPSGYNLSRLRSFYWRHVSNFNPQVIKERRKEALKYKYKNYEKYKKNQSRAINIVRRSVNDFLKTKVKVR